MTLKLVICLIFLMTVLSSGCISYNTGDLVQCSDFHKITDKYRTPSGTYIVVDGVNRPLSLGISSTPTSQDAFIVGEHVWWGDGMGIHPINLTVLPEEQSGMRDACKVLP